MAPARPRNLAAESSEGAEDAPAPDSPQSKPVFFATGPADLDTPSDARRMPTLDLVEASVIDQPRTLWYMGVKTRLVPEFIRGAVADLVAPGGTVLDLCAGTGIVARSLASEYRVHANDVQAFSAETCRAHLVGGESWARCLDHLDPAADLERNYQHNREHAAGLIGPALHQEDTHLRDVPAELAAGEAGPAAESYRAFLAATPEPVEDPAPGNTVRHGVYEPLAGGLPGLLRERRRDPAVRPYLLHTLYHANVYFGLRQAMIIDSLRYAIDALPEADPFREQKRSLYLAALIQAASISTSGTSHFAQPRSMKSDSELVAVCRRRSQDIELAFYGAVDSIRREWGGSPRHEDNQVYSMPAETLLAIDGPLQPGQIQLIYFDPPYTADHYSRFYHVLETLVSYDYPQLELRGGELTRGRYPVIARRFQSDFCKAPHVEEAFRHTVENSRRLGANLLVSYSADSGLLLKTWKNQGEEKPLNRLLNLFRDYYGAVEIRQRDLMHSGQGDSNRTVRELLVLCEH